MAHGNHGMARKVGDRRWPGRDSLGRFRDIAAIHSLSVVTADSVGILSRSLVFRASVPLLGRPRDIVQAARQELTIERWDKHRFPYELLLPTPTTGNEFENALLETESKCL